MSVAASLKILLLCTIFKTMICEEYHELDFKYHNHSTMTDFLKAYASKTTDLVQLYSIGRSVRGSDLWVMKVTAANESLPLIPNIKLLANIHGNEAAGREILLHFIPYLVNSYRSGDEKVVHILNNSVLHILPSLNPDGFAKSAEGRCSGSGRENGRFVDLNRSFPDFFRNNSIHRQPETLAVMEWMNKTKFILSASLHGGAMVANYPFESTKEDLFHEISESRSPDDDVFQSLALSYSKSHPIMHLGLPCPNNQDKTVFKDGITNGAAWYSLIGGMQDYNYAFHGCMELTLEVSCCKYPPAKDLLKIWSQNQEALTTYCLQAGMGVKGIIRDANTLKPIGGAHLIVKGRNMTFYTTGKGEFYRILLPGDYRLRVKAANYSSATVPFSVHQQGLLKKMTILNILLHSGEDNDDTTEIDDYSTTPYNSFFDSVEEASSTQIVKSNFDYYDDYINNQIPHQFYAASDVPCSYLSLTCFISVITLNIIQIIINKVFWHG